MGKAVQSVEGQEIEFSTSTASAAECNEGLTAAEVVATVCRSSRS